MTRYVVGLGGNIGDRLGTLREAVRQLRARFTILAVSRVYETAPVGGPEQRSYLNAAVLLESETTPDALLGDLLSIENEMGRVRMERWGPRTIDLDLLWMDAGIFTSESVTVPHPRLAERRFAVLPLLDVVPSAEDPHTCAPYVLPEGEVWRFDGTL